jgi:hypothetical protein
VKHFAVSVVRDGECILTIESNCLAGKDLTQEDEQCIRDCAQHLLSFIGKAPIPQDDYQSRYFDLLLSVGQKHAGESRHETAKRYIMKAEEPNGIASAASAHGEG